MKQFKNQFLKLILIAVILFVIGIWAKSTEHSRISIYPETIPPISELIKIKFERDAMRLWQAWEVFQDPNNMYVFYYITVGLEKGEYNFYKADISNIPNFLFKRFALYHQANVTHLFQKKTTPEYRYIGAGFDGKLFVYALVPESFVPNQCDGMWIYNPKEFELFSIDTSLSNAIPQPYIIPESKNAEVLNNSKKCSEELDNETQDSLERYNDYEIKVQMNERKSE